MLYTTFSFLDKSDIYNYNEQYYFFRVERARSVVEPLLTNIAVELLGNCLDTREYHFWQSLGPNWTLTKYVKSTFFLALLKHKSN